MRNPLNPDHEAVIELAPTVGFCAGVDKAIRTLERCARDGMEVETLGPVVHNREVVDRLAGLGIKNIVSLDRVKGTNVGITAHGTDPATLEAIKARNLKIVDTTCSIVRRSQHTAAAMAKSGFRVLVFGDPTHPEVQGLLGWSGPGATATLNVAEIGRWAIPHGRLGMISQTTQSHASFKAFVCSVLELLLPHLDEVRIVNTICGATQTRQALTTGMAKRNDLMIVVGGAQSANTRRLAETAGLITETRLIENASDLEPTWIKGHRNIGLVAGTSTPEKTVRQVASKLKKMTRG